MISIIWDFVKALVKALFGLGASKDPSATQLAASNATAQTELAQQEANNEMVTKAAAARTAAGTRIMLGDDGPPNAVNLDPDAAVNTSPDAHFRD